MTNDASGGELLPCPFCGYEITTYGPFPDNAGFHHIDCFNCGVDGPMKKTLNKAKEAWNTRHGLSRDEVERLVEIWDKDQPTHEFMMELGGFMKDIKKRLGM